MLRRLHPEQPEGFAFTPANLEWAKGQMAKYPEGRQASAVIPLLWRAQEQEGWLSKPAIEEVARLLGMAYIRVLEVATFYFMFQLQPTGSVTHVQVCGTTSCMICGAEDLIAVCRQKISPHPHALSPDGKLSWEEVECLGACANAPMAQIGKDYYEDLTTESFGALLDALSRGDVPEPGSQTGRFSSEPAGHLSSLTGGERISDFNASVALAREIGDTVKRITGDEPQPWTPPLQPEAPSEAPDIDNSDLSETVAEPAPARPSGIPGPRGEGADDLTLIKGVGPKLEELLNSLGFFHLDQLAAWTPAEIAWVDENLEGFKGRVTRDAWVEQARQLAEEGSTPHAQKKIETEE